MDKEKNRRALKRLGELDPTDRDLLIIGIVQYGGITVLLILAAILAGMK